MTWGAPASLQEDPEAVPKREKEQQKKRARVFFFAVSLLCTRGGLQAFRSIDADGGGQLHFDEFCDWAVQQQPSDL